MSCRAIKIYYLQLLLNYKVYLPRSKIKALIYRHMVPLFTCWGRGGGHLPETSVMRLLTYFYVIVTVLFKKTLLILSLFQNPLC